MRESFLWECFATYELDYDKGKAPYHDVQLYVVCDEMVEAEKALQVEIFRTVDRFKLKANLFKITTLKRGLRVVIP